MASDEKTDKSQLLGVTFADVAKTFVGVLLGVGGTLFVGWWQDKEPHLRYSVSDPIQFPGEKFKVGIVNVVITNDGTKKAEKLEVTLALNGTKIQEVKTSPEHLKTDHTKTDEKCLVTLPLLNHTETLQVSALYYNADLLKGAPVVSVRADDVVGDNQPSKPSSASPEVAILVGMMITFFICIFPLKYFDYMIDIFQIHVNKRLRDALGLPRDRKPDN
jgi:hypothetical protein